MTGVIAWVALLVGLALAAYVWKLQQELNTASRRLDRYNRALFDANDEVRRLREELNEATASLRVEILQRTGSISFRPEMTVRETEFLHPQAQQVLAAFHLGGCSSCAVEPDDTLTKVCSESGVDVNLVVANLNRLVGDLQGNGAVPQPVKLPNVELEW
jgi:heterodisulfide reductase subunit B